MTHDGVDRRSDRRAAPGVLLALGILLAAAPSEAGTRWDYPLLPHVSALAFFPETPNDASPTTVVLSSVYSGGCWGPTAFSVPDSAHVVVDLASCTLLPDSVSSWTEQASLGVLSAGPHTLTVHADVTSPGGAVSAEEITVPFDVVHATPPPPPPADSGTTLISGADVEPPSPTITDPVSVTWRGLAPFTCMPVTSARVVDDAHLEMTLLSSPGCADTVRAWSRRFDLGLLAAGHHTVGLDIALAMPESTSHVRTAIGFDVIDPDAPAPPPADSLRTVMSPTHPNPFRDVTRFSVSLMDPQPAQVAVYDLGGRRVATVFRGLLPAGTSELAWDGRAADGSRAAGGIYFYRLTVPGRVVTRRVVLLATP